MSLARRTVRVALLVVALALAGSPAAAHDCASQQDCEETGGYLAGIGLIGGIIAIIAGLLGNDLGSTPAPSVPPVPAAAPPPAEAPPVTEPVAAEAPAPVATAPPPVATAQPTDEIEIPWDDLIAADDPGAGGPSGTDDLEAEPGVDLPARPPDDGGLEVPWDELIAAEPPEAGGEGEDPLAGDPVVEEPGPTDEPAPVEGTPKAPGLETAETVGEVAGNVKDAIDEVTEHLDALPIDDETKEKIKEQLGDIAEKAGTAKEYAEKAQEYIQALDENLAKTKQLGVNEQSRDFLGWWRVTFKAAGELAEKFVDGLTAPVTGLLGEEGGEKAQDLIHAAVPIKEFGDELSKLPTSAAEHVVKAQHRDQADEVVAAAPTGDPFHDDLADLYPRDWSKVK